MHVAEFDKCIPAQLPGCSVMTYLPISDIKYLSYASISQLIIIKIFDKASLRIIRILAAIGNY